MSDKRSNQDPSNKYNYVFSMAHLNDINELLPSNNQEGFLELLKHSPLRDYLLKFLHSVVKMHIVVIYTVLLMLLKLDK